jgi:excisionase family DNA binding protein
MDRNDEHDLRNERTKIGPKWLTKEQAAAYLACSPRLIERLVAERRLSFTKVAKFVRISTADLDAFAEAGRVEAQSREAPRRPQPKPVEDARHPHEIRTPR